LTRTKLWRLSLAAILGFGWLFLTPAYSDDPLGLAAQEIQQLNASVADLNYKEEFQSLISEAEDKYDAAVTAKEAKDDASDSYDAAVAAEATALSEKQIAQTSVDTQTAIVSTKLTDKNNKYNTYNSAQIALNAHIATYGNGGSTGVYFRIYPLSRMGNYAYLAQGAGLMCHGTIPTFDIWAGSGAICGLSQNIIGIFEATVTVPAEIDAVKFAGATDDGFRLYVDGVLATEQWQEQGTAWSPYTQWFDTSSDKTLQLQAWWYNGGGPGNMHVGVGTNQWWSGIPAEWIAYGSPLTQQQIDDRASLQSDRDTKYSQYQTALSEYNSANSTLTTYNQTLTTKTAAHNTAITNTSNALAAKNNAIDTYNQSIIDLNNAIDAAWNYYEEQLAREIAIAIAQAAANAAANQPKPEPTPEQSNSPEPTPEPTTEETLEPEPSPQPTPSPEPSPEQTEPVDPTPEPTPETTDEPKPEPTVDPEPTPEPSPEPSPLPSDIDPEPTPEPEPTPAEPSKEPSSNSITDDLSTLANLTSKDNVIVKLTPEQAAAVANVLVELSAEAKQEVAEELGIKTAEIAVIAEAMKENPILAAAVVEFSNRAEENADAPMPYTLADATTELAAEQLLSDPIGAFTNIDFEKVFSPSEWGKDMTDDQREKAQEVIVPVIIAGNIVAAAMTRRIG
jgi:hypothetical protein